MGTKDRSSATVCRLWAVRIGTPSSLVMCIVLCSEEHNCGPIWTPLVLGTSASAVRAASRCTTRREASRAWPQGCLGSRERWHITRVVDDWKANRALASAQNQPLDGHVPQR